MTVKRILIISGLFCLLPALIISAPLHPDELEFETPEFTINKPQIVELDNGIKLFLVEEHELPTVYLRIKMKGGSLYDPANKTGLADVAMEMIESGGTEEMTAQEVEKKLDFLASNIGSSASSDSLNLHLKTLKENFEPTLNIFKQMLFKPAFQSDRLKLQKMQKNESIKRKWDYPFSIAMRNFRKILYGENTVWGKTPTIETINNIERKDLIEFHDKYFNPKNAVMGVVGDFNPKEIKTKLNKAFKNWKPQELKLPELPEVKRNFEPGIYHIEKDIEQTNIVMGHLGVNEKTSDRFKIFMFNDVLSGGFSSRLFRNVRQKRGLAYSVWGNLGLGKSLGSFSVSIQTKPQSTCKAIKVIKNELRKLQNKKVTKEEFKLAVDKTINNFSFKFESGRDVIWKYMRLHFDDILPKDYWDTYIENIKQVTRKEIKEVANKYIHPDRMVILVVGNRDNFDCSLSELGEVTEIELETPGEGSQDSKSHTQRNE